MPIPVLVLPILAFAAQAAVPPSRPIVVTGRPWAPFISPMGEPYRAHSTADDTLAIWFRKADENHDGMLTADEMQADADRFFATLDTIPDGEIDPTELEHYESEIAPEIQVAMRTMHRPGDAGASARPRRGRELDTVMGFRGALQGGARYALLNIPEPVAAADSDFNRGVSLREFRQAAVRRFQLLDSGRTGKLTLEQLQALRSAGQSKRGGDAVDARVGNSLPGD